MVKDATRQDNILDIFFSNDPDSISNISMVENVFTSDHSTVIIETSFCNNSNEEDFKNIYSSSIPLYETMSTSPLEWENVRKGQANKDWESCLKADDPLHNIQVIMDTIESSVTNNLELKAAKNIKNYNGKTFKSKNMIPRNVRSLYKTKLRLSNKLRKCKSKSRIHAIRKRMINVELDIKNHYSKWNDDKE